MDPHAYQRDGRPLLAAVPAGTRRQSVGSTAISLEAIGRDVAALRRRVDQCIVVGLMNLVVLVALFVLVAAVVFWL